MPKQRPKFISTELFAQQQIQRAAQSEADRKLVLEEAENIMKLKQLLDQHDDKDCPIFNDLSDKIAFRHLQILIRNKMSGDLPIHIQSKQEISCIQLDQFTLLWKNKNLSGDGNNFNGFIRMFVDDKEVTIYQLQQQVVNHYETKNLKYFQETSDLLLKVDLVYQISDETRYLKIQNTSFCKVALNCYFDLRGWRIFKFNKFPGEEWIISKSILGTNLHRSNDGCYHITSIYDLFQY